MKKSIIGVVSILFILSVSRILYVNRHNYDIYKITENTFEIEDTIKFTDFNFKIQKKENSFEQYSEENEADMIYTLVFADITNIGKSTINIENTLTFYEKYKDFTNLASWSVVDEKKELLPGETAEISILVEFRKGEFWDYYENYQIGKIFQLLIVEKNQTNGIHIYKIPLSS
ncbi:MAG: hypothetical protein LBE23_10110 [Vagococcus sp.]|jgi:hypothetical protein|nr:hypothetical protein [Vagococcus sp.]